MAEAAIAIAETRAPEAFSTLKTAYETSNDQWFRTTLLTAIALTRQDEAFTWLLTLIEREHATVQMPAKPSASPTRLRLSSKALSSRKSVQPT